MTIRVLIGDVMKQLAVLPDESVDCVVTSPPYWGLRDYGVEGQLGMEKTLNQHIENMVKVFNEVKRVLKKTGTCWINYGDCYATSPNGRSAADTKKAGKDDRTFRDKPFSTVGPIFDPNCDVVAGKHDYKENNTRGRIRAGGYLKPKDLCMIPNRLAIALQDSGWWIRSEIIWAKPNPMPESVIDRPATSHEKIWLITKSQRYFYNAEAVRTALKPKTLTTYGTIREIRSDCEDPNVKTNKIARTMPVRKPRQRGHSKPHSGFNNEWDQMTKEEQMASGAHLKNVWTISTKGFPDAHFATFPTEIPETCIKAGCPVGGVVLDPFGGAGTTAMVADRLGRDAILIELNPAYVDMSIKRITNDAPLFVRFADPDSDQRGDLKTGKPKPRTKRKTNE